MSYVSFRECMLSFFLPASFQNTKRSDLFQKTDRNICQIFKERCPHFGFKCSIRPKSIQILNFSPLRRQKPTGILSPAKFFHRNRDCLQFDLMGTCDIKEDPRHQSSYSQIMIGMFNHLRKAHYLGSITILRR